MAQASKGDLRTIANGLIPAGFDAASLTPEGRDEVRAAIDVILRLHDAQSARLTLALEQLDRAAAYIDKMKLGNDKIGKWLSAALEDSNVCEEMKSDIRDWFNRWNCTDAR